MGICGKCNGAVPDQDLKPDAHGQLVCRRCAGAADAQSDQLTAPAGQAPGPGFWRLLAVAAAALCALLLIGTVALGAGRSALKKQKEALEGQVRTIQAELTAAKSEQDRLNSELNAARTERKNLKAELLKAQEEIAAKSKELAELQAGKKPPARPKPGDRPWNNRPGRAAQPGGGTHRPGPAAGAAPNGEQPPAEPR